MNAPVPHMSGRKVPLSGRKLPVAERSGNQTFSFEMTVENRAEREFMVEVAYALSGNTVELLSARPCHADHPLTAYEWEQIEGEAGKHAAEVLAECPSLDMAVERAQVARAA